MLHWALAALLALNPSILFAQSYFIGDFELPGGWGAESFKPSADSGKWRLLPRKLEHGFLEEVVVAVYTSAQNCVENTEAMENALASRLVDAGLTVHRESTQSYVELSTKIPSWEGRNIHYVIFEVSGNDINQNFCIINLSYRVAFDAVQYAEVDGIQTAWIYRNNIYEADLPLLIRRSEVQSILIERSRMFAEEVVMLRHDARKDPAFKPWLGGSAE